MLIYLVIPIAILIWWLLYRTRWGLGLRAVGENAETAFASGRNPVAIKYQALFVGGLLAGLGRSPSFDCIHHELGRIYDRWKGFYCHCVGDLLQMASDPCDCRGAGFQRSSCISTSSAGKRCQCFTIYSGYDPLCFNLISSAYLGWNPQTFRPCHTGQGISRDRISSSIDRKEVIEILRLSFLNFDLIKY